VNRQTNTQTDIWTDRQSDNVISCTSLAEAQKCHSTSDTI